MNVFNVDIWSTKPNVWLKVFEFLFQLYNISKCTMYKQFHDCRWEFAIPLPPQLKFNDHFLFYFLLASQNYAVLRTGTIFGRMPPPPNFKICHPRRAPLSPSRKPVPIVGPTEQWINWKIKNRYFTHSVIHLFNVFFLLILNYFQSEFERDCGFWNE